MDRKKLKHTIHYFYLAKKCPFENRQMAFSLLSGSCGNPSINTPENLPSRENTFSLF